MSEHEPGGGWGQRGDVIWWSDQQNHNLAATSSSTTAPNQPIFTYKMASSFENPTNNQTINNVTCNSNYNNYNSVQVSQANNVQQQGQWWYNPHEAGQQISSSSQNQDNEVQQSHQIQQQQQSAVQQQCAQQQQQHNLNNQHHSVNNQQQSLNNQQQRANNNQQQQQSVNNQQQQNQQKFVVGSRMPRGKNDNSKPRGRMTAYAFFVQTCREEHKKKHPEENVIFSEFSKKCAERWKTMLDKEKKRFHEMAEKDKVRYDSEMLNYTPPKGGEQKVRGKKRRQIKDPNAPKRSLSAFFWFCNDERQKVKAVNPDYGVGDVAKELGRRWSEVEPELKSKYESMAEKDKQRYDREMTAYKKKPKVDSVQEQPEEEPEEDEEVEDDEDDE